MSSEESAVSGSPDAIQVAANVYTQQLREKILFGLSIYKFVSPTMLHTFLGTSTPSALWKGQVLAELLQEGAVISETVTLASPHDRSQTYTVLHLPENVFSPPETSSSTACTPDEEETAPVAA